MMYNALRVRQFSKNFLLWENPPRSDYSVIAGEIVESTERPAAHRDYRVHFMEVKLKLNAAILTPDDIR